MTKIRFVCNYVQVITTVDDPFSRRFFELLERNCIRTRRVTMWPTQHLNVYHLEYNIHRHLHHPFLLEAWPACPFLNDWPFLVFHFWHSMEILGCCWQKMVTSKPRLTAQWTTFGWTVRTDASHRQQTTSAILQGKARPAWTEIRKWQQATELIRTLIREYSKEEIMSHMMKLGVVVGKQEEERGLQFTLLRCLLQLLLGLASFFQVFHSE